MFDGDALMRLLRDARPKEGEGDVRCEKRAGQHYPQHVVGVVDNEEGI